jgi:YbbR domain-containing protein
VGLHLPIRLSTAKAARLVLSLIIAFAIWAFVTNERDPDRTASFTGLEIQGAETLSPEFQIVESLPVVSATVKGPQSVVQPMTNATLTASVDLSGIAEAGTYEIDVDLAVPPGLRDVDLDPETIVLEVDSVVSRIFDITVLEPVNPPATLTSISISSTQVRLIGVQQNVERVDRVEVPVVLSGRTESFSFATQPVPIDSNGQPMADTIRVEPQTVQVSVEFEVRAKSVPVIVQCACPVEGGGLEIRDLLTAIAIPSTVRVEGPEPLLAGISSVRTLPINIEALEVSGFLPNGAELDGSVLPDGVTLERQSIDVYVEVEQSIQSFTEIEVEVVNEPEGRLVSLSPATVTFDLQGSADLVASLTDDPPLVIVDLDGLDTGIHIVAPRIVLPPDVRVVNLQPVEIQVSIEPLPTPPTPVPTATPSTPRPNSSSLPTGQYIADDSGSETSR